MSRGKERKYGPSEIPIKVISFRESLRYVDGNDDNVDNVDVAERLRDLIPNVVRAIENGDIDAFAGLLRLLDLPDNTGLISDPYLRGRFDTFLDFVKVASGERLLNRTSEKKK